MRNIGALVRSLVSLRVWALAAALACAAVAARAQTADAERVVNIYAELGFAGGKPRLGQGTGFLVGADGTIVTAYHVIRGALSLTVWDGRSNKFENDAVRILAVDPEHDLALLRVVSRIVHPHFELGYTTPTRSDRLSVVGNFRGMKAHRIGTRPTEPAGVARSEQWQGDAGSAANRTGRIDVIPLDMAVLKGMSGAPVLADNGRVIGLLSGSAEENGGVAWAIPSKYITRVLEKAGEPRRVSEVSWPGGRGGAGWDNLRREYVTNAEAADAVARYHRTFEELEGVTEELTRVAASASGMVAEVCATVQTEIDRLRLNYGYVDAWRLNKRLERAALPDGLARTLARTRGVIDARHAAEREMRELIAVFDVWLDGSDLEGDALREVMAFRDKVAVRYRGIGENSYEATVGLDTAALTGFMERLEDGLSEFPSRQAAARYIDACRDAGADLARYGWMHESATRLAEHHLFDAYAGMMRRFEQYFTGMPVN